MKILGDPCQYSVVVDHTGVETTLSEDLAFSLEVLLIRAIGRKDLGLGPLFNFTDGGEGASGYIFTDADRLNISRGKIGKRRPDMIGNDIGRYKSPDFGHKISLSLIGNTRRQKFKDAIEPELYQDWVRVTWQKSVASRSEAA